MRLETRGQEAWVWVGAGLIVTGAAFRQPMLVALGALVLLVSLAARWWALRSLSDVIYRREFSERRAFPDETIELRMIVENRKWLPLSWLEVEDYLPQELPPEDTRVSPSFRPKQMVIRRAAALGGRQAAAWGAILRCAERGYFRFGPARLHSGDLFGMHEADVALTTVDPVIVYPRVVPLPDLAWPGARPFGERGGGERLYEDPQRIAGIRDYVPGDPLRRIDWKATARRGELQSRVYEPSTTLTLIIALDAATMPHSWEGSVPELLERAISAAAGLATRADEDRYSFGLLVNASYPGMIEMISIPPSRAPGQLPAVLESLAVVNPYIVTGMEELLGPGGRRLPLGSSLVVVGAHLRPSLAAALESAVEAGHPTMFVCTADEPPVLEASRIAIYHAGPALGEAMREARP